MSELKNKYNRVASDASQLQSFADEVCDFMGAGSGTKLYQHGFRLGDSSTFTGWGLSFYIINNSNISLTGSTGVNNPVALNPTITGKLSSFGKFPAGNTDIAIYLTGGITSISTIRIASGENITLESHSYSYITEEVTEL